MGQYIVIGLATNIVAPKQKIIRENLTVPKFLAEMKKRFNSTDIYSVEEDDEDICYDLKPEVAEQEMLPFLKAFYNLRYADQRSSFNKALTKLSKYQKLDDWLKISDEKLFENFQTDFTQFYEIALKDSRAVLQMQAKSIILDMTGKVIMECYDELFWFMTTLIRQQLKEYRLAQSVFVYITD